MTRNTLLAAAALAAMATSIAVPIAVAAPAVRAKVIDGTLRVSGTPFADRFALRVSGTDPNQLQLDIGDDGTADDSFDLASFSTIDVGGGGGDDFVRLDTANGAFTTTRPTLVDGGKGDDTLIGGSGNELFFGGRGNDFVDGNGAPTRRSSATATTPSSGTRAMARTASRARRLRHPPSTARAATRSSLPPPAAAGSPSPGTPAAS